MQLCGSVCVCVCVRLRLSRLTDSERVNMRGVGLCAIVTHTRRC